MMPATEPYLAGMGYRTAAPEDSRLLPLAGLPLPTGDQPSIFSNQKSA